MVALSEQYNFPSVVEEFLDLKSFDGPNGPLLKGMVKRRAAEILAHPDIRYVPAFKLLDLVAEIVNVAHEITLEPQLRQHEASALLQSHISDTSPMVNQFMLDAALERARYEPMMLDAPGADALTFRNLMLAKRWHAMRDAHQTHSDLPNSWADAVSHAVEQAIAAPAFADYRVGPLLQFFAEMLQQARNLHDSAATLTQLEDHIGPQSPLWKRYALKAARYKSHETPAAQEETRALPNQARMPDVPLPSKHSLH